MTIAARIEAFIREAAERAATETPEERAERVALQERLLRRYGQVTPEEERIALLAALDRQARPH